MGMVIFQDATKNSSFGWMALLFSSKFYADRATFAIIGRFQGFQRFYKPHKTLPPEFGGWRNEKSEIIINLGNY
jgi:hypothetical protein